TRTRAERRDAWLAHLRDVRGVSPHTLRAYSRDLDDLFEWLPEDCDTPGRPEMRRFLVELEQRGLAPSSIRRKLAAVRAFYRYLREHEGGRRNPGTLVRAPKMRRPMPAVLTEDEVERLLALPSDARPRAPRVPLLDRRPRLRGGARHAARPRPRRRRRPRPRQGPARAPLPARRPGAHRTRRVARDPRRPAPGAPRPRPRARLAQP